MRKNFLSQVVVKVRESVHAQFGTWISPEDTDTLLSLAASLGYVSGKRGRDGGYLVTDKGLGFIGEDAASVTAQEERMQAAKTETLKENRKEANKARKANLANEIKQAVNAA